MDSRMQQFVKQTQHKETFTIADLQAFFGKVGYIWDVITEMVADGSLVLTEEGGFRWAKAPCGEPEKSPDKKPTITGRNMRTVNTWYSPMPISPADSRALCEKLYRKYPEIQAKYDREVIDITIPNFVRSIRQGKASMDLQLQIRGLKRGGYILTDEGRTLKYYYELQEGDGKLGSFDNVATPYVTMMGGKIFDKIFVFPFSDPQRVDEVLDACVRAVLCSVYTDGRRLKDED